jgi:glutathione S-transferase
MLTVYGFSRVNAVARGRTRELRVIWALEEMGLPYRVQGMDHPAHELNTEAYRRLSPFAQIPAIDDDGVIVSESGAIVLYLARKAAKLIPADHAGDAQVVRWCFAALNTVELPILYADLLSSTADKDPAAAKQREEMLKWVGNRLQGLEDWLDGRKFVATDDFTVADILMSLVLSEIEDPKLYEPYPRVRQYRERCKSRPAWKRTIDAYCEYVKAA